MILSTLYLFLSSMVGTVIFVRLYLTFFPQTNVYIGKYNVHHLYTGALFIVVLSLINAIGFGGALLFFLLGIGSGLVVDQLVYLVTTDGGHKAYFGRKSVIGVSVVLGSLVILGLTLAKLFA